MKAKLTATAALMMASALALSACGGTTSSGTTAGSGDAATSSGRPRPHYLCPGQGQQQRGPSADRKVERGAPE